VEDVDLEFQSDAMAIATSKIQSIKRQHAPKTNDLADVSRRPVVSYSVIALAWPFFTFMHMDEAVAAFSANGVDRIVNAGWVRERSMLQIGQSGDDFSVANVAGTSGEPVKLAISLSEDVLKTAKNPGGPVFMMFHGLPAKLSFSSGFRVNEAWAVSLKDVSQLTLLAPPDYNGAFNLTATLHRGKQAASLVHAFKVTLKPASAAARQVTAPLPNVVYASPETEKASLPLAQEAELLARAESLFKNGDFVSARLIFGELAERGSQKAALRMAQTYDPDVLKSFFIVGMTPHLEKARHWYTRAMELGAMEARDRLNVLSKAEAR
jgi:TPR repeat protein